MKGFLLGLTVTLAIVTCAWAEGEPRGEALVVFKAPEGVKVTAASLAEDGEARAFVVAAAASAGAEVAETYDALSEANGTGNVFVLVRSGTKTTEELIEALKGRPDVLSASPNYRMRIPRPRSALPAGRSAPLMRLAAAGEVKLPNDPGVDVCWGLRAIRAPEAWMTTTGSQDIHAAVMDSGIYEHPDLKANLASDLARSFETDPDEGLLWSQDIAGHGTHVAGIVGAVGNNGIGVVGVNWEVSLIPVKLASGLDIALSIVSIVRGLDYLVSLLQSKPDMKLAAVNMSISVYLARAPEEMKSEPFWMAYRALDRLNRTLIVVAASNEGLEIGSPAPFDEPQPPGEQDGNDADGPKFKKGDYCYPAAFAGLDNFIVVGATALDDSAGKFSCWGASVDIAAPGVEIWSAVPGEDQPKGFYAGRSGTSMAAPHATGAAALLLSAYPNATPGQIKRALLEGANKNKNPAIRPFYPEYITPGYEYLRPYEAINADGTGRVSRMGLLDVKAALDLLPGILAEAPTPDPEPTPEPRPGPAPIPTPDGGGRSSGCDAGLSGGLALALAVVLKSSGTKRI